MQVKDLVARPEIILRCPMTVKAPLHVERLGPPGDWHLIDRPMAGGTTDPFVNVNGVIKKNEIREVIHPGPANRPTGGETGPNRSEHRRIGPDLRMTRHADVCAGNPGEGAFFDRVVAVTAIDPIIADVVFVTERHRLMERNVDVSGVGRPPDGVNDPPEKDEGSDEAKDDDSRMDIGSTREDLGHER